ncbi:hypothetical protein AKO1_008884 [Acrasis kona]|uniref:Uncharacterized protein n=1 Tax=Acrasis kona TaxID=1008807 RepID=A0AAW2ZDT7_9EUKA
MHIMYVLRNILDTKTIYAANQFRNIPYFVGMIFLLLNGEGGGILTSLVTGRPSSFLLEDYKFASILLAWTSWYILSESLRAKIYNLFFTHPTSLLFVLPNEFRRALSLCSGVVAFHLLFKSHSFSPWFLAGLSTTFGGQFVFPILERRLLQFHTQSPHKKNALRDPSRALIVPFLCSAFYNYSLLHPGLISPERAQFVVVAVFLTMPILGYIKPPVDKKKKD